MRRLTCWPPLPPGVYLRRPVAELPYPAQEPDARLYAFARQGLHSGARALGLGPDDEVLVPAYHHGSEVEALRAAGLTCRFYGGGDGVHPEQTELEALLTPRVRALHLVHTLGFPQDVARWRRWCDTHGLLLIEDAAQAWLATVDGRPVGSWGELAVFCTYKTVAVLEGALVLCRPPVPPAAPNPSPGAFEVLRRHGAWLAQRSALATAVVDRLSLTRPFDPEAELALHLDKTGSWSTTEFLLRRLVDPDAAATRRAHYRLLLDHTGGQVPEPFATVPDGASPFAFPLQVDDKAAALARLSAAGVHAFDLWSSAHPLTPVERFPAVQALRGSVVGLPVHQGLRPRDLATIARAAAPRARSRRLDVEVVDGLATAEPVWREVAAGCPNPFATHEWARAWQQHHGDREPALVGVCRDRSGRALAVLPLERTTAAGVRTLRFWASEAADLSGPVCAPEDAVAAAHGLRALLAAAPAWDVLLAERLPGETGWPALLGRGAVVRREASPVLALPHGGWEGYLAGRSANFRQQVRRRERALLRRHGASFRLATAQTLSTDLDTLFHLHGLRWPAGTDFLARRAFHADFARVALERGWLRLWTLEAAGRPVASWYGLRYASQEWYYQAGRDPAWDGEHVGAVLLAHTVRAAAQDGISTYRFLRGDEPYKLRWTGHDPGTRTVVLGRGARGGASAGGARLLAALPPSARARARAALERS